MRDNLHDYRVCYRKKGDNKDVVTCIGVDDPSRLERIVMDIAGVKSLDELELFESHLLKKDGTTEVTEHVKEKRSLPAKVQTSTPAVSGDLFQEKSERRLPQPMGVLTHFFKTATAEVKAYA